MIMRSEVRNSLKNLKPGKIVTIALWDDNNSAAEPTQRRTNIDSTNWI